MQAGLDPLQVGGGEMLVGEDLEAGLQRGLAALEPADLGRLPDDPPVGRQRDGVVGRGGKCCGPRGELGGEHLRGRVARRLAVDAVA